MKILPSLAALSLLALLLAAPAPTVSQTPAEPALLPQLDALRTNNEIILKRQEETLKRLETLKLEAKQLRFFTKRG